MLLSYHCYFRWMVSIVIVVAMTPFLVGQKVDSLIWKDVETLIDTEDYLEVISILDSISSGVVKDDLSEDKHSLYWFRGLAHLRLKRYSLAVEDLLLGMEYVDSTDVVGMSKYWSLLGTANVHSRNREKAELYLNKIIDNEDLLCEQEAKRVVIAYGDRSAMHQIFGESRLADIDMQKALGLLKKSDIEDDELEGNFNLNLGGGYLERNLLDSAYIFLTNAQNKYNEVLPDDHYKHGSVLINLAVYYSNKGNLNASLESLKSCEKKWRINYGDIHPRMAIIHINKASNLLELNSFEKVLDNCYKAKSILDSLSINVPQYDKALYNNMALAFEGLGDLDEAELYYSRAADIIKDTYGIQSIDYIRNRYYVADLARQRGEYDSALKQSFNILEILKDYPNRHFEGLVFLLVANIYVELEDRKMADLFLNKASDTYDVENGSFYPGKMQVLLDRMNYYLLGDNLTMTLQLNEEISEFLTLVEKNESYSISSSLLSKYSSYKASLAMKQYYRTNHVSDLEIANSNYLSAIDYLINWKTSWTEDESELLELEEEEILFSDAMKSIYATSEFDLESSIENALLISNNSKNHQLRREVRRKQLYNKDLIPEDVYLQELSLRSEVKEIQSEINDLYLETMDSLNENLIKDARSNLIDAETALSQYVEFVSTQYPEYYSKHFDHSTGLSLKEIRKSLPQDGVLLDFCVLDSFLYTIYVSKGYMNIRQDPFTETDRMSLRNFHKSLTTLQNLDYEEYVLEWSTKLLHDFKNDKLAIDKLFVLPDDELSFVPFEILDKDGKQLVQSTNISYAWSIEQLITTDNNINTNSDLLGFAPSYVENSDADHKLYASLVRSGEFELPGAKKELENIDRIWNADKYFGVEATEHAFKSLCKDYSILHLSMHGLIDEENALNSALVFNSEQDSIEDGLLYSHEIYNLPMQANLVVLSACNTGFGKLKRSEGVMSMSRSFAAAGVPATVMSLWKVPDQSTSKIMTSFYRYLSQGNEIDESLRLSKLDYLATIEAPEFAHPKYWAGFVLTGNTNPVMSHSSSYLPLGLVLGLVIFGLLGFWGLKKK